MIRVHVGMRRPRAAIFCCTHASFCDMAECHVAHWLLLYFYHSADLTKWVGVSTSSDSECEAAPPTVGSSTATIVGGHTEFSFDGDVDDWVLCYKHGSDDWRLYTGIVPVSIPSASSADTTVSDTQRTKADVSFTMEGEISSYPEGSDARTAFLSAFLLDLARALGVNISRFIITGMRGGSVVVDFTIESTG